MFLRICLVTVCVFLMCLFWFRILRLNWWFGSYSRLRLGPVRLSMRGSPDVMRVLGVEGGRSHRVHVCMCAHKCLLCQHFPVDLFLHHDALFALSCFFKSVLVYSVKTSIFEVCSALPPECARAAPLSATVQEGRVRPTLEAHCATVMYYSFDFLCTMFYSSALEPPKTP